MVNKPLGLALLLGGGTWIGGVVLMIDECMFGLKVETIKLQN